MHIIGELQDADTDGKRVILAVWSPLGVGQTRKDHEVYANNGGKFLKIDVVWPL